MWPRYRPVAGSIRPIALAPDSVNQSWPAAETIPSGDEPTLIGGFAAEAPGVMLWTWLEVASVNQTLPSGPAVIPQGVACAVSANESLRVVSNCRDSSDSNTG